MTTSSPWRSSLPTCAGRRDRPGRRPQDPPLATGYRLKDLFLGHQTALGIATQGTLELYPRPEAEFPAFFRYQSVDASYAAGQPSAAPTWPTPGRGDPFDDARKVQYLRRDGRAYNPRGGVAPVDRGRGRLRLRGRGRGRPSTWLTRIGADTGGRYLGEELSELDKASRHGRYATRCTAAPATGPSA